jgi:antitoxin MazE
MKTQVIKIGNSKGIRIPKSMLDESGLGKEVDLELREGEIVIRPIKKPRENWSEAFRSMSSHQDDSLLDINNSSIQNRWDKQEWEW